MSKENTREFEKQYCYCIEWLNEKKTVKNTFWTTDEQNALIYLEQLTYKSIKPEKFYKKKIDGSRNIV